MSYSHRMSFSKNRVVPDKQITHGWLANGITTLTWQKLQTRSRFYSVVWLWFDSVTATLWHSRCAPLCGFARCFHPAVFSPRRCLGGWALWKGLIMRMHRPMHQVRLSWYGRSCRIESASGSGRPTGGRPSLAQNAHIWINMTQKYQIMTQKTLILIISFPLK